VRRRHDRGWGRRSIRLGGALAVLSAVLFSASFAEAQAPSAVAPNGPVNLARVTIAGSEEDTNTLLEALREPLLSLGLSLRGARLVGGANTDVDPPSTEVAVTIDTRLSDRVDLVVRLGSGSQAARVQRSIPRDAASASRAVVAEEVAYAVRSTLDSLLRSPRPSLPPPVLPPPPALAAAAEVPVRANDPSPHHAPWLGLDAAVFATGRGVARATGAFGGGAALEALGFGAARWRPALWLAGAIDAPFGTSSRDVSLQTTLGSLRAMPMLELPRNGPVSIAAGVGVGLDLFHVVPSAVPGATVMVPAGATHVDPLLEAQLIARVQLFDWIGLLAAIAIDYDTRPHHYLTEQGDARADVLAPWTVRPSGYLGVCVPLTGATACAGPK
jgi:hypothetical protein